MTADATLSRTDRLVLRAMQLLGALFFVTGLAIGLLLVQQGAVTVDLLLLPPLLLTTLGLLLFLGERRVRRRHERSPADDVGE